MKKINMYVYYVVVRLFGFVSRKPNNNGNNECHLFAELDAENQTERSTANTIIQMLERYLSVENK